MIYYTVYKITNLLNNKIYVGFHKTENINDSYMGSGKLIKKAIEKHGVENFRKDIIAVFDTKEEAEALERQIVDKDFVMREDTYNMSIGGNVLILHGKHNGFYGKTHTEEVRKLLSNSTSNHMKGRSSNPVEYQGKIYTIGNFAKVVGITKNVLNNVIYYCGNPDTEAKFVNEERQRYAECYFHDLNNRHIESAKLMSRLATERFKGVSISEEHKKNISDALMGHKKTPEHVDKINRNPEKIRKTAEKHTGMKRSDEAKRKMSLAKKGKPANNRGKTLILLQDGTIKYHDINLPLPDGSIKTSKKKAINDETGEAKRFYKHEELPPGWRWKYE